VSKRDVTRRAKWNFGLAVDDRSLISQHELRHSVGPMFSDNHWCSTRLLIPLYYCIRVYSYNVWAQTCWAWSYSKRCS